MGRSTVLRLTAACLAPLLIVACGVDRTGDAQTPSAMPAFRGRAVEATMPDVTLRDTNGQPYNLRRSPTRPVTLLFLASPSCGSHCDALMKAVTEALSQLRQSERDRICLIYVTIDPSQDDGRAIQTYLDRFGRDYVGLMTDGAATRRLADHVGVDIFARKATPRGKGRMLQTIQVTAFLRGGSGVVAWTDETPVADIAHDLALLASRE